MLHYLSQASITRSGEKGRTLMRRVFVFLTLFVPSIALAQLSPVEITPTVGYRWGGDIRIESLGLAFLEPDGSTVYSKDFNVGISSGGSYGLRLDFTLNQRFQLELMANFQQTQLKDGQGLFGEVPGGFLPAGTVNFLDITIHHYQAGLVWYLNEGPNRWFLVGSAGITAINPHSPLPNDSAFSAGLGGGIRMDISDHLGVRFEGRYYFVSTDEGTSATYHFENRDCIDPCTYTYRYKSSLPQTEFSLGLIIKL
jgi:opacity protein-like surface antigen